MSRQLRYRPLQHAQAAVLSYSCSWVKTRIAGSWTLLQECEYLTADRGDLSLPPQEEMLGKVQEGECGVLVMDPQSTRIMSAACRISEILNYGIARASLRLRLLACSSAPALQPASATRLGSAPFRCVASTPQHAPSSFHDQG